MKNFITLGTTLLLSFVVPLSAQSTEATPGKILAEEIFGSINDGSNNSPSAIDMGTFVKFGNNIFRSMDYNEDKAVNFKEFSDWDFGFNFIAQDADQLHAYQAAQKIIFAVWDRNGDSSINRREYHKAMTWDFTRADTNDDALLTKAEFLDGYIIIKAYRAAILGN